MAVGPINRAANAYLANAPRAVRGPNHAALDANLDQLHRKDEPSFAQDITQAIDRVDATQQSADSVLAELARGEHVDLHATMVELEKADISLRTMTSVRDKAIAAYEQIMNMAI